jgi:hypothetical protein
MEMDIWGIAHRILTATVTGNRAMELINIAPMAT